MQDAAGSQVCDHKSETKNEYREASDLHLIFDCVEARLQRVLDAGCDLTDVLRKNAQATPRTSSHLQGVKPPPGLVTFSCAVKNISSASTRRPILF